jgi:hypothetical protein
MLNYIVANRTLTILRRRCKKVKRFFPQPYQWNWDSRLNIVLITFSRERINAVLDGMHRLFKRYWEPTTIHNAPAYIGELVKNLAGISPGQIIFADEEIDGTFLFAAWWPWADGSRISLRIGLFQINNYSYNREETDRHLREWFKIANPD